MRLCERKLEIRFLITFCVDLFVVYLSKTARIEIQLPLSATFIGQNVVIELTNFPYMPLFSVVECNEERI